MLTLTKVPPTPPLPLPLFLLLLILLSLLHAHPLSPSISPNSGTLLSKRDPILCFQPALTNPVNLAPLSTDTCYEAIRLISCNTIGTPRAYAPMIFTRNPGMGFEVPHKWIWNDCSILIDILDDEEELTLPLATVAALALSVVDKCVTKQIAGGYGGRTQYMHNGVIMHVIVSSPQGVGQRRTSAMAADWLRAFGELPNAIAGEGYCPI